MKRKLLFLLALTVSLSVGAFAQTTYCLVNSFGEQASLTITGETITGTYDYTPFGSTVWPVTGTYDRSTGALHFVATNPNPDNCTFFANSVTFDYQRNGVHTGSGSFSNDCGNAGSLDASATQGPCAYAGGFAYKKGEFGSTGAHKMNRLKLPVPAGVDFKTLGTKTPVASQKAAATGSTYCLVNSFGEEASLTISGETVTGTYDYTPFGSTVWPVTGTYDRSTGALHFVATNPNPDNCTFFANSVTFDYQRTGVHTGTGSFSNDCGNAGSLDASATQGPCAYAGGFAYKKGEFGSTGAHKMNRLKMPVPAGLDFKTLGTKPVVAAANAASGTTYCLVNSFGEEASLTISGETITGTYDYTPFGSTVWPVTGTYDRSTGALHFVATNPNPDNCTFFANSVTFDYQRNGVHTGSGSFSNDCGNAGSLDASATQGPCAYAGGFAYKKGEFGSTGAHKMNRTKVPVPAGLDFKTFAPGIALSVSPNPPVRVANISVKLDAATKVNVSVYNQTGGLVKTIANSSLKQGTTTYSWNLLSQNGTKVQIGYYTIKATGSYGEKSVKVFVGE